MSSHRLQVAAAGGGEWEVGNRLLVEGEELRIARAGVLGRARVASRPAATVAEVIDGDAAEMLGGPGLRPVEHETLQRVMADGKGPSTLIIRFEDPERGAGSWVATGDAARVGGARTAVEGAGRPAEAPADLEDGVPVPSRAPRTPGAHRTIVALVAVLIVAVIAAVAFLAVRIAGDAEIPGFGDDDGPAESAPSGAPEGADGDDAPPADDDPAPPPETRAPVAPFGPTGLVRIEREVAARIGRDRPRYTQIIASDEFAIFTVLVGGGRLDAYTWREGVVTGPGEVRVTGNPGYTPAQAAFTRGDVRLAALPRLVRRAERIPLGSGTEVSTAIIQRFLPFSSGVVFLVNTSGGRGNAQLRANARGKVTEIIR